MKGLRVVRLEACCFIIGPLSFGPCSRPKIVSPKSLPLFCWARLCDTHHYSIRGFTDVEVLDGTLLLLGRSALNTYIRSYNATFRVTDMPLFTS